MEKPTKPEKKEIIWNKNVEKCKCGIEWKKLGKQCPVCFEPSSKESKQTFENGFYDGYNQAIDDMTAWIEYCLEHLNNLKGTGYNGDMMHHAIQKTLNRFEGVENA